MAVAEVKQPYIFLMTVCERVDLDEGTGRRNILGIYNGIMLDRLPVVHEVTLYLRVYGGDGIYEGHAEFWWMGFPNQQMAAHDFTFQVLKDGWLTDKQLVFEIPFEEPGMYEFRASIGDGRYLAHPLLVEKRQ